MINTVDKSDVGKRGMENCETGLQILKRWSGKVSHGKVIFEKRTEINYEVSPANQHLGKAHSRQRKQ